MTKQGLLGLGVGLCLCLFLGCSPGSGEAGADAPVVLRVHVWDVQPAGLTPGVLQRICDEFSAANPGIRVRLESSPQQDYKEQIFLEVSYSDSPDVFMTWSPGS